MARKMARMKHCSPRKVFRQREERHAVTVRRFSDARHAVMRKNSVARVSLNVLPREMVVRQPAHREAIVRSVETMVVAPNACCP